MDQRPLVLLNYLYMAEKYLNTIIYITQMKLIIQKTVEREV